MLLFEANYIEFKEYLISLIYNAELHYAKKALLKHLNVFMQFKHLCGIAIFLK